MSGYSSTIVFDAASSGPLDTLVARYADRFYNRDIPDSFAAGRIKLSLPTVVSLDEGANWNFVNTRITRSATLGLWAFSDSDVYAVVGGSAGGIIHYGN